MFPPKTIPQKGSRFISPANVKLACEMSNGNKDEFNYFLTYILYETVCPYVVMA